MLKFTYTETGFHLERLAQPLEELVALRVVLAMRVGQRLCVEPISASFLLPVDLPGLNCLETEARQESSSAIALCVADAEYVEVSLQGSWITADPEGAEGVFVAAMSDRTEFFLLKLWHEAQTISSFVREASE